LGGASLYRPIWGGGGGGGAAPTPCFSLFINNQTQHTGPLVGASCFMLRGGGGGGGGGEGGTATITFLMLFHKCAAGVEMKSWQKVLHNA